MKQNCRPPWPRVCFRHHMRCAQTNPVTVPRGKVLSFNDLSGDSAILLVPFDDNAIKRLNIFLSTKGALNAPQKSALAPPFKKGSPER